MSTQDLETQIIHAMEHNKLCSFATVEDGKPRQRYMMCYNDGLNIHLGTNRKTHKVDELEDNHHVSLLLGYEADGSKEVVEIEGTCQISSDAALRKQVWNDDFKAWFDGPDDEDYVVLDIHPSRIEFVGEGTTPQVWHSH